MSTTPEAIASNPDAPVVPAPAQPDGAELETGNEAAPSPAAKTDTSDSTEPEVKGVQRRIDELTRARREAERREVDAAKERDHWRDLAIKSQPQPKVPEIQKPQTLADFAFDEGKYHSYLLGEASKAATEAAKKELQTEQQQRAKQEQAASYVKRAKDFAKDHSDYKEVAESAPISDQVAEVIVGLESGPEVAYYLGKNPDMAAEISRLPQTRAAYELGMIAAKLQIERERATSAKALISSAPPPAAKIDAGGAPATAVRVDSADSDTLSDAEWTRRRNAQEQARLRKLRNG